MYVCVPRLCLDSPPIRFSLEPYQNCRDALTMGSTTSCLFVGRFLLEITYLRCLKIWLTISHIIKYPLVI